MMIFYVTTAQTVYERYVVSAESADAARADVEDPRTRASLSSAAAGYGEDEHVISVEEDKS